MIKMPANSNYSLYYIQALLSSKYLEWITFWHGEIFRGNFVARGTKVLEKLPIVKIDFENTGEKELHNKIASLQEALIQLQGQIDQNAGNQRKLVPLQRQFNNKKTELDEILRALFNLGEDDNLIPSISELYAAH